MPEESWKDFLTDDSREALEGLLAAAKKHRGAYEQADDKKIAILWSVLVEMKKELDELKSHVGKLDEPFKAIVEVGESEKKKAIEKLITQIVKPTDQDTQEATQKLVDSLMNF